MNDVIDAKDLPEIPSNHKKARRAIFLGLLLYVVAFPFVLWLMLLSSLICDSPKVNPLLAIIFIFANLFVPFSMIVSIWEMGKMCIKKNGYEKVRFFRALPFYVFFYVIAFDIVFDFFISL